jgi:hypothetical protein
MDLSMTQELICDHDNCRRSFTTLAALNYHKCSCQPSKRRFQVALSRAKELWEMKKKARMTLIEIDSTEVRFFDLLPIQPIVPASFPGKSWWSILSTS